MGRIRGLILLTAVLSVITASCAMYEPEVTTFTFSEARTVKVPYLNKTINEVSKNEYRNNVGAGVDSTGNHSTGTSGDSEGIADDPVITPAPGRDDQALPELVEPETNDGSGTGEDDPGDDVGSAGDSVLNDWIYYGECCITHYCPCGDCCGVWATGCTASGTLAEEGRTVAAGDDLPFGTELLINDHVYVVEDRGVGAGCVDIFVNDHQYALDLGMYYTDVYVRFPEG